jgi:hypothetical protein
LSAWLCCCLVGVVVGDTTKIVALGIIAGLPAAVFFNKALSSLLYQMQPFEPTLIASSALLLAVVAVWPVRDRLRAPRALIRYQRYGSRKAVISAYQAR